MGDLKSAKGKYHSVRGRIVSAWKIEGGQFKLSIIVPPNTTAEVFLPTLKPGNVLESGKPVANAQGVKFLRQADRKAVFEVGSGRYEFVVPLR